MQCKIKRLEEKIGAENGSAGELQKTCMEQEATIDGFEEEAVRMWEERDRLEEKDAVGSEAERAGFERKAARLEEERPPCNKTMVALQCPCGVLYCHQPKS